jgi:cytoskeletal protein RodZ
MKHSWDPGSSGKALRKIRERAGLSVRQAATKLDVTGYQIGAMEDGGVRGAVEK